MEKMTFDELWNAIKKHNEEHNVARQWGDSDPLTCVVVFKNEAWPERERDYTLEERSYKFRSDEKHFLDTMLGNSIFAETLDGSDSCRLDWYLYEWPIDYCYIMEQKNG